MLLKKSGTGTKERIESVIASKVMLPFLLMIVVTTSFCLEVLIEMGDGRLHEQSRRGVVKAVLEGAEPDTIAEIAVLPLRKLRSRFQIIVLLIGIGYALIFGVARGTVAEIARMLRDERHNAGGCSPDELGVNGKGTSPKKDGVPRQTIPVLVPLSAESREMESSPSNATEKAS